jgi:hypothetical protein
MQLREHCITSNHLAYSFQEAHHNTEMSTTRPSSASAKPSSTRKKAGKARPQRQSSRRTTVTLSPEAQQIVERFKSASGTSTSAAIDQIIQRSEPKPSRLKKSEAGFLVLDVPFRRVNVTLEDIKRAEDEMDREYVERLLPRKKKPASKGNGAARRT